MVTPNNEAEWVKRMAALEDECDLIAAGATPYNLMMQDLITRLKRDKVFMPVLDSQTVGSLNRGETGWIVKRAISGCKNGPAISSNAHVYPNPSDGIPIRIELDDFGILRAWLHLGASGGGPTHYIGICDISDR